MLLHWIHCRIISHIMDMDSQMFSFVMDRDVHDAH
jgi:hypothetical protein